MSAVTTVDIYCDGYLDDGTKCPDRLLGYPGTPRQARTQAKRVGWHRVRPHGTDTPGPDGLADLCPAHARHPQAALLRPHRQPKESHR